ncbi:MAG: sodium:solute symporter family protein, partial [Thermoanaerobaculia bacterium]|nr:sodium:solute symporter family protein [Thermoanaerobaculia bacterium]
MWLADHWLMLVLLAGYLVVLIVHARQGSRETRGLADYFVGGRRLGGFAIGISFFATYSSTNTFLGFSGRSYSWGAPWLLLIAFAVVLSWCAWTFVAPRLRDVTERLGSVTVPDFIGFRFQSPAARLLAALIVLFSSFIYMTAVFKGIGNLLEAMLELPYPAAIGLVWIIVTLYTAVGGFHSVVRTDVTQGLLMVLAAALLFLGTVRAAGGPTVLADLAADDETGHLFTWGGGVPVALLLGTLFATTVKFVVEPRQLSRFYALADPGATRVGVWVSTLSFLVVFSLLAPIGLYAHRILAGPIVDTDRVVPELLTLPDLFGAPTQAFLFLAILSAALSSLDSVLLVVASTFHRDVWQLALRSRQLSEAASVRHTRFWVAFFALVTAVIALRPPAGIIELTAFSGAL